MRAVVIDHFLGHHVGLGKHFLGRVLVALFPGEDVVVMLARAVGALGLAFEVFPQDRGVGFHRLEGIDDDGQFLVFDLDRLDAVGGGIAVGGDDIGDFLTLEQHLAVGQNHLLVTRQRRHPVQAKGFKVLGRQHGQNAGYLHRLVGPDRSDAGVGVR